MSRNHSWNHLYIKMSLKILVIFFLRSFFFTDHLKHKTVNKTTCRMPSAIPCRWSNHRRCSVKKGVLRSFAKFTKKHLCQSFLFIKVTGFRKETLAKVVFFNFAKFLRTLFLQNTSRRLLMSPSYVRISWRASPLARLIFFLKLLGFYFGRYFWWLLNSPNFMFQRFYSRAMKQNTLLVLLVFEVRIWRLYRQQLRYKLNFTFFQKTLKNKWK